MFLTVANNLRKIDIMSSFREEVRRLSPIMIDMNKSQLYDEGIFSDGTPTPDYSNVTIDYKLSPGSHDHRIDHMTFKDEEGFYHGFYIKWQGQNWEFWSTDIKTEELVENYGKNIFGLTEDNIDEFIEGYLEPYFMPKLVKMIEDAF